jgi:hypothetical protein
MLSLLGGSILQRKVKQRGSIQEKENEKFKKERSWYRKKMNVS